VDLAYRQALCERGKIGYIGGKCELIRLGEIDDIDVVVGYHSATSKYAARVSNDLYNGFVCKNVRYIGKSAHAAGSPEDGIDALAASALAMHAIDAQRESFRDADRVRIHGFLSSAGTATNVIADQVTMQYLVRAANMGAIRDASYKFDRAIKSAAMATGCGVEIHTLPGYLPNELCHQLTALTEAIETAVGASARDPRDMEENYCSGSTDFGDISHIKPLLQFNTSGIDGIGHHPSYHISDERIAYVLTAKIFALTAYNLLKDGGREARRVRENHTPKMTKSEYLAYMEGVKRVESMPLTPAPSQEHERAELYRS
jgi:metal-dependent amidase/aminoacylase/carboxypeptidase family protein